MQVVRLVHEGDRLRRLREVSKVAAQQVLGRTEERGQRQLPRHFRQTSAREGKLVLKSLAGMGWGGGGLKHTLLPIKVSKCESRFTS